MQKKIVVYSHSMLFYWWPVWFAGFIMALVSYMSDQRLAIVPAGTVARRDIRARIFSVISRRAASLRTTSGMGRPGERPGSSLPHQVVGSCFKVSMIWVKFGKGNMGFLAGKF